MTLKALVKTLELDLPRDQKYVLLGYADHANDDGYAYPSLARIAWKLGYEQPRSVRAIVQKLLDSGVMVILQHAHGRTPTLYRIMWDNAPKLAEFDPQNFKTGGCKGAENAPHPGIPEQAGPDDAKSLSDKGENTHKGAESAPHGDGVRKTHPNESVGVRSDARRGAFSARRGAVATAPEPLTINQRRAGARASESRTPAPGEPPADVGQLLKLNNSARLLGIEGKRPDESIDDLSRRVEAAHGRRLAEQTKRDQARIDEAADAESIDEQSAEATG